MKWGYLMMTNSGIVICPCCGTVLNVSINSMGIGQAMIENPIMNPQYSFGTNQIMQTQNANCSISNLINSMINKGE